MSPYPGIPKNKTKKMEKCVERVMEKQGKSKSNAIAICHDAIMKKNDCRIETKDEVKRRLFSSDFYDSSLHRDILRMKDRDTGEKSKLSKLIKSAEEKSPRLSLFNEFLGTNILNQSINTKTFPKYKKGIVSVSVDKIIKDKFNITNKMWFGYFDNLKPVNIEEIQIDLDESKDVLVQGYYFLEEKDSKKKVILGIDFQSGLFTGYIALYSNEENSSLSSTTIKDIINWSKKNNFLKGKTVDANGSFVRIDNITMDDVILKDDIKRRIKSGTVDMLANMDKYRKNNLPIKRGILMEGEPGCQPAGELVLMADGTWCPVEQVTIGDDILSPQEDGSIVSSKVTNIKNYMSDIYTIECGDSKYRVAGEHLIVVKTPGIKDEGLRSSIKQIIKGDIGTYSMMTPRDFVDGPRRAKRYLYGVSSPAVTFQKVDFKISPYCLGLLLGDGSFRHGITITNIDKEIIDESKKLAESFNIELKRCSDKYSYRFSSGITGGKENPLTREIKRLGLYGLSSRDKFIPKEYVICSVDQRLELLAGLIDTDGYKDKRNKSGGYELYTVSKRLAEDIYNIAKSLGFGCSVSLKSTEWCYNGEIRSGEAYRLFISTQDLCIPVRLERKIGILRDSGWKNIRHKRIYITEEGLMEEVYGFTLDSKSGWYITNNWNITHNTGKTLLAKALANQIDSTFIWVTADDVIYPSDISSLYDMARELAPTVLLFEDIDYIGKSREEYRGTSFDKVTGELLNQMDGLQSNEGIITIASSNYPKALDKAIRNRPGRFDIRVKFDLPDEDIRKKMIERFFEGADISEISLSDIIKKTEGYTGAYIKELAIAAKMLAVSEGSVDEEDRVIIKRKFFDEALNQLEKSRNLDDEE